MDKLQLAGLTMAMTDCALAAGTTTTLTLGTAPNYCVDGKAHVQATTTNVQPSIVDLATGTTIEGIDPGFGAAILVGVTSSESTTLRMIKGEQAPLTANASAYHPGNFINPPQFGPMPENFCPLGYVIVKVATDYTSGAKYIFGSSNTTATGAQNSAATAHANTFVSLMTLPSRPQVD